MGGRFVSIPTIQLVFIIIVLTPHHQYNNYNAAHSYFLGIALSNYLASCILNIHVCMHENKLKIKT